jgi:hypothetical protein
MQHVSTRMSHHQANLEPLNIFEFLLTVPFISKAADPGVSSGWPSVLVQLSIPVGGGKLYTWVSSLRNKKNLSKNSEIFSGSKLAS